MNNLSASPIFEQWVHLDRRKGTNPSLLFVSGAQRIGKSTLVQNLADSSDGKILAISLDDFYIQYYERLTKRMLAGKRRAGARLHLDEFRTPIAFDPEDCVNSD